MEKPVLVREVWAENLEHEVGLISRLLPFFPLASFDTEFPGMVIDLGLPGHVLANLSPPESYTFMRSNVNAMNIIQLGLAISTPQGALPDLGTDCSFIWQFNFRDFDLDTHLHNPDSIKLLKSQGIDFDKNRDHGIDSSVFAGLILRSGLFSHKWLTWVTFHGSFDFGLVIKILTRKSLPSDFNEFMRMFGYFFGRSVYDAKHIIKSCGGLYLYGGLEKVAAALGVARVAGKSHQAGSDSLLTLQTFLKLKKDRFGGKQELQKLEGMKCCLHGLGVLVVDERIRCPFMVRKLVPVPRKYMEAMPYPRPIPMMVQPQPILGMVRTGGFYC